MKKISVKEAISLHGTIRVYSAAAGTKEWKLRSVTKNLIMTASNVGRDLLTQWLLGLTTYTGGIAWGAIGMGIAPAAAPIAATGSSGVLTGAYQYLVTYVTALGETTAGAGSLLVNPSSQQVALTAIPIGISGTITGRNIYRTKAGGSTFYLLHSIANNTTTTYTDNTADGSLPATVPPTVSTAGSIAVALTDTALQAETNRTSPSFQQDYQFSTAQIQFYFTDAQLANTTYYEFGTFVGGSSSANSGQIFNHALFSAAYIKVPGQDTTVEVDIALN